LRSPWVGTALTHQRLVSARCNLATKRRPASGRGQAWVGLGRIVSWIVLLGIPLVCMGEAVAALSGRVALDAMWIALSLILAIVFLHGAGRVRWDLAGDRAGSQTDRHRNRPRQPVQT
jgi:hypothetical protein